MDSDALLTVVTVHRAGGFSAAADALGRSQPAISRRIALLEAELGGPVFERTAAGVRLSALGQALLPHAERALAAIADARAAVRDLHEGHAGTLTLAVVGTLAGPGLTRMLRRFATAAPGAQLSLRTATSAQVSDLVRTGAATIGARYFADRSADLDCRAMAPEPLAVVCAPEHPLAGRRIGGLAELAGEHWLAFPRRDDSGEPAGATLFALFLARGIGDLAWSAIDSLTAQKRMVEAGIGLALLPRTGVDEELRTGSLAVIDIADLAATNPVFAVTRHDGYLSRTARLLLDILTDMPAARLPRGNRKIR